jgi:hypothetical protein
VRVVTGNEGDRMVGFYRRNGVEVCSLHAGELMQEEAEGGAIAVTRGTRQGTDVGLWRKFRSVLDFCRSEFGTSQLKRMQLARTRRSMGREFQALKVFCSTFGVAQPPYSIEHRRLKRIPTPSGNKPEH